MPSDPAPARRPAAAIVPSGSVAGRTLMFLIAIMTFLSSVSLGGVVLVQKSAAGWSADVGRELTISVTPETGEVMQSNLRTLVDLAEQAPGIGAVRALSEDEGKALLRPWLGGDIDLSGLTIPRLIAVQIDDPQALDLKAFEADVAKIPGARVETHAAWREQLGVMAGTIVVSGLLVLGLILIATILAVIFATRGTMASNREIVDVLHFIGASNRFIAGEFQGRFVALGLRGAIAGALAALVFFLLTSMAVATLLPQGAGAQLSVLFGRFALGWTGLLGIALLVPIIAGLTGLTSRLTVRRFLTQIT